MVGDSRKRSAGHLVDDVYASVSRGVAPGTRQQAKSTRRRNKVPSSVFDVRFEVPRDI